MRIYSVYEGNPGKKDPGKKDKSGRSGELAPLDTRELTVLAERFSIPAALFTPFWCIWHGLWLELLAYFGVAVILAFIAAGFGQDAAGGIGLVVAILIGFEAAAIRGKALVRRGYTHATDLRAPSAREAELVYVAEALEQGQA
ncbi:DUF2628 domain-containing protein [Cucumibacter marinus]|uniref:DUF2628 domain-containing protein n=1 Tax=Cucumibacter marinus TaxID=1121252 RepID=UPI0003FA5D40|nr:DUF2628 domain-containing protein [Cucumibacter marinus]